MRCLCCNKNLNDAESTARHPETNEFLDICFTCCNDIGLEPIIRSDLQEHEENIDDEFFELEEEWEDE